MPKKSASMLLEETETQRFEFIITQLELAITFHQTARAALDSVSVEPSIGNSIRAQTAARLARRRARLSVGQIRDVNESRCYLYELKKRSERAALLNHPFAMLTPSGSSRSSRNDRTSRRPKLPESLAANRALRRISLRSRRNPPSARFAPAAEAHGSCKR